MGGSSPSGRSTSSSYSPTVKSSGVAPAGGGWRGKAGGSSPTPSYSTPAPAPAAPKSWGSNPSVIKVIYYIIFIIISNKFVGIFESRKKLWNRWW